MRQVRELPETQSPAGPEPAGEHSPGSRILHGGIQLGAETFCNMAGSFWKHSTILRESLGESMTFSIDLLAEIS